MATVSLSGYSDNEREFNLAFGRVLAEWSYIETSLFGIFGLITGLEEDMARGIFYSARSFSGRYDMLASALAAYSIKNKDTVIVETIKESLMKANQYYGFRNSLAHNMPIAIATAKGAEILLVETKGPLEKRMKNGINERTLMYAYVNFNNLQNFIDLARGYIQFGLFERLPELLERLRMLPNEPYRQEPSQSQEGRRRQRQTAPAKAKKTPDFE